MDLWLPPKPAIIIPAPEIKRPVDFRPCLLPGMVLPIVSGSTVTPISNTFLQVSSGITGTSTTKSFTSQNIGAADATRRIICAVNWRKDAAASVLTSVTIGGVAATIHTAVTTTPTRQGTAIASALVPTGTTATVDVVIAGTGSRTMFVALWRQINESSSSPTDANTVTANSLTVATTINIPTNGCLYTTAMLSASGATTFTWTGATERYDSLVIGTDGSGSGASETGMTLETARAVQAVAAAGTTPLNALSTVSWG
jgi:hypothetical protein